MVVPLFRQLELCTESAYQQDLDPNEYCEFWLNAVADWDEQIAEWEGHFFDQLHVVEVVCGGGGGGLERPTPPVLQASLTQNMTRSHDASFRLKVAS